MSLNYLLHGLRQRFTASKFAPVMITCALITACDMGQENKTLIADNIETMKKESTKLDNISVTSTSIQEILFGYQNDHYTAEEITRVYIKQIEYYEPAYNAFIAINPNALDEARDIDRRRNNGESLGPLAGVPLVIKETIDHIDYPSTFGWKYTSANAGGVDFFPLKNAAVTERLLQADAIILGKTNIPVFSDNSVRATGSWDGPTFNAVNRNLAPGASSSGTATAVAAGFAAAGLGEETGGSIQNPASAQSLVGLVPTFSLVPNSGVSPLGASTLDVIGPIAKTVYDTALLMDVIAGSSNQDPKTIDSNRHLPAGGYTHLLNTQALQGKRLGLYGKGWSKRELSDETQTLYRQAIEALRQRGAVLVEDPFAGSGFAELALADVDYDYRGLESMAYDISQYIAGLGVTSLDEFTQRVSASPFDQDQPLYWYVERISGLRESLKNLQQAPDLTEFFAVRKHYRQVFDQVMQDHQLDALVFPQATTALPGLLSEDMIIETTVSALNIAGLTALTVPAGQYQSNQSPFGLIFVGKPWSEATLLALAYDFEQATQHRVLPELRTDIP